MSETMTIKSISKLSTSDITKKILEVRTDIADMRKDKTISGSDVQALSKDIKTSKKNLARLLTQQNKPVDIKVNKATEKETK